jgi:hypothetical protein
MAFFSSIIDFGGSGNSLAVRNWYGGLGLINYSGGGSVSIDMSSGRVVLDETLTSGAIYIRGVCQVQGESGGATIDTSGVVSTEGGGGPTIFATGFAEVIGELDLPPEIEGHVSGGEVTGEVFEAPELMGAAVIAEETEGLVSLIEDELTGEVPEQEIKGVLNA